MIDVQYEQLVDNFEPEARRILAHPGGQNVNKLFTRSAQHSCRRGL